MAQKVVLSGTDTGKTTRLCFQPAFPGAARLPEAASAVRKLHAHWSATGRATELPDPAPTLRSPPRPGGRPGAADVARGRPGTQIHAAPGDSLDCSRPQCLDEEPAAASPRLSAHVPPRKYQQLNRRLAARTWLAGARSRRRTRRTSAPTSGPRRGAPCGNRSPAEGSGCRAAPSGPLPGTIPASSIESNDPHVRRPQAENWGPALSQVVIPTRVYMPLAPPRPRHNRCRTPAQAHRFPEAPPSLFANTQRHLFTARLRADLFP
ncbi:PREDICTED: uncharacterized protein-like [Galeopterus variegatus]|uniref:Uncharacterized protein-like n=1 Tax=Galeopterus variegatus TaxID=482537 RepID=A0ABM0Q296_GALVR|nr:PREDICTED: uncharacterized protein-like [Galeopterus variegatus]XP_008589274.1 PREDICTED: uncharacterized protein-like [Galeopterus variegatus]